MRKNLNLFLKEFLVITALLMFSLILGCGTKVNDSPKNPNTVDSGGGTVKSDNESALVDIPEDAISEEETITVKAISSSVSGNIGSAFEFGPDGVVFNKPVTISIVYNEADIPSGIEESKLKLGKLLDNEWIEIADSTVDTEKNIVTGPTNTFSTYGVIVGNAIPVANAGADKEISKGTLTSLDGSGSSDADGNALTYLWTFTSRPSGSNAAITGRDTVNPSFTPDVDGNFEISLVVNDGKANSLPDTIIVTAVNNPPVANAGSDLNVSKGKSVLLNGNGSSDPDKDALTYLWTITSRPSGSNTSITAHDTVNPSFTPDVDGTYEISLVVNDGKVDSSPDNVIVTAVNNPPIARAGSDYIVTKGISVQLNGSGSSDPNGDTLTYLWTLTSQPSGSDVVLNAANTVNPTFTPVLEGTYVISLVVNDGQTDSLPDTVTMTAVVNSPPVANAGPDRNVITGKFVQLDGSGSSDAVNDTLAYLWTVTSKPSGSNAVLNAANTISPTFTPDKDGTYVISLVVKDGELDSVPDTVKIVATTDKTPPYVSSTLPANGASGVGIDTVIKVVFSEVMDPTTINPNTFMVTGQSGSVISGNITYNDKTATFTPYVELAFNSTYSVNLTTNIRDYAGNSLVANYKWSFKTEMMLSDAIISAGSSHTVAIKKSDGTVWAWGENGNGQLGDGTWDDSNISVEVSGLKKVIAVAAGYSHSVAVKSDGTVWAWGANWYGQLGTGKWGSSNIPVKVSGLTDVIAVAAGGYHTVAVKSDGTVWAWGANWEGQLGDGTTNKSNTPVEVSGLTDVIAVAAGYSHSVAVKSDGTVWAWGSNEEGQLGDGTWNNSNIPVEVSGLTDVIAVATGSSHTVAVKSDGRVWAWGANWSGQLGAETWEWRSNTPVEVSGLTDIKAVAAGGSHTVAVKSDGRVWAWGSNWEGQLGDGTTNQSNTPVEVSGLIDVIAIAAGNSHTVAVKSNWTVWAWGSNEEGQLGDGTSGIINIPVEVKGLTDVKAVAAEYNHTVAIRKSDGTVWAWGANWYGQLGDGTWDDSNIPVEVSGLTDVKAVATGDYHTVAIKSDGTVWAWGADWNGQLGTETWEWYSNIPVEVSGLTDVIAVAAGDSHSVAVKSDGTVWSWGSNGNGQLGDGTWDDSNIPVEVSGLTDVIAVAAGGSHTVAFKSDGTVWSWGANWNGQLGDGTSDDSNIPVAVSGLADVIAVAAGSSHTVAVKSDGTVWAWGSNGGGQLGDGTWGSSNTPVEVSGFTDVIAVAAGGYHTVAVKSDGTVWTWGANWYGQLGTGTWWSSNIPVEVSGLTDVIAVAAGGYHTIAIESDGTVWAWGWNYYGQLGIGTFGYRNTPGQVIGY